jgi:fructokinase
VFEPAGVDEPRLFDEAVAAAHILKYSNERLPRLADSTPRPEHLLLEIETCGLAGLRYRLPAREHWDWRHLKAIPAPYVADTAGAGDWCTSGFLFQVASVGRAGLERASPADLEGGLRFGQAAAAVACGYEGARGAALAHSCADFLTLVQKLACGDSLGTLGEGIQRFAHARAVPHTASECPICTT